MNRLACRRSRYGMRKYPPAVMTMAPSDVGRASRTPASRQVSSSEVPGRQSRAAKGDLVQDTAAIADGAESVDDISVGGTDDAIGDLRSVDELLERELGGMTGAITGFHPRQQTFPRGQSCRELADAPGIGAGQNVSSLVGLCV